METSNEIKNEVLRELYQYEFREQGERNLFNLREEHKWEERVFEKTIDRMVYDDLIKPWAMGGVYRIQVEGVLEVEREGLVDKDLLETNNQIREGALRRLAESYEEGGRSLGMHYSQLIPDTDWPDKLIVKNLQILVDLYRIETRGSGSFEITFSGIDLVEEWKRRTTLFNNFENVADLQPHPRGKEFQKIFSRLITESGWQAEESVRTSHEEIDVIFSKRREYFLVECKWEKDPIEAGVVREFFGKISNRAGVNGVIASMSGFTGGAVSQANDYATRRVILLVGPIEIEGLFRNERSFDELLDQKYKDLVTKREIFFE